MKHLETRAETAICPEIEKTPPAEILYLEGEIPRPSDMFEYFLQGWRGKINWQHEVVPTLTVSPSPPEGTLTLSRKTPLEHWKTLIAEISERRNLPAGERRALERTANYLSHCQFQKRGSPPLEKLAGIGASFYLYQKLIGISVWHYGQPSEALEASRQLLSSLVLNEIDPFTFQRDSWDEKEKETRHAIIKNGSQIVEKEVSLYRQLVEMGPATSLKIPILHQKEPSQPIEPGETRIERWLTLERLLGRFHLLERNRATVVIVGPANSGKSTLTASLLMELNNLTAQTMDNFDFAGLRLFCGFMDLDPQSHDIEKILIGSGVSDRSKVPWTQDLALATARQFIEKRENIIIADAPGGPPDKITETVVGPADLVILLIAAEDNKSWQEQREQWKDGLRRIGQTPVILLRSRKPGEISQITGEPLESTITSFRWAEEDGFFKDHQWINRIGGRVVGLERKVVEDDLCISSLAWLLLFDLLPQVVIARKRQTQFYLTELINEQYLSKSYFNYLQERVKNR